MVTTSAAITVRDLRERTIALAAGLLHTAEDQLSVVRNLPYGNDPRQKTGALRDVARAVRDLTETLALLEGGLSGGEED